MASNLYTEFDDVVLNAVKFGLENEDEYELLFDEKIARKIDLRHGTLLQVSAINNNPAAAKCSVNFGARVNETQIHTATALKLAIIHLHGELTRILAAAGTAIIPGRAGALESLRRLPNSRRPEMTRQLVLGLVDRDLLTNPGRLLEIIAQSGLSVAEVACSGCVKLLQLMSAQPQFDINSRDSNGKTALHLATELGDAGTVLWILEKGANVELEDGTGETPLELASNKGYEEIVGLLIAAAASVERL